MSSVASTEIRVLRQQVETLQELLAEEHGRNEELEKALFEQQQMFKIALKNIAIIL